MLTYEDDCQLVADWNSIPVALGRSDSRARSSHFGAARGADAGAFIRPSARRASPPAINGGVMLSQGE